MGDSVVDLTGLTRLASLVKYGIGNGYITTDSVNPEDIEVLTLASTEASSCWSFSDPLYQRAAHVAVSILNSQVPARADWEWPAIIVFDSFELDLYTKTLTFNHETVVYLRPMWFRLLSLLLSRPEEALSRDYIFQEVWGYLPSSGLETLKTTVCDLKRVLRQYSAETADRFISVRGGYRFDRPGIFLYQPRSSLPAEHSD